MLLIDKPFTYDYQEQFMKSFLPGIKFDSLSMRVLRENSAISLGSLIYELHFKSKLEFKIKEVLNKSEISLEKEIVPLMGLIVDFQYPNHYISNGKIILKKLSEIEFQCQQTLSTTHLITKRED